MELSEKSITRYVRRETSDCQAKDAGHLFLRKSFDSLLTAHRLDAIPDMTSVVMWHDANRFIGGKNYDAKCWKDRQDCQNCCGSYHSYDRNCCEKLVGTSRRGSDDSSIFGVVSPLFAFGHFDVFPSENSPIDVKICQTVTGTGANPFPGRITAYAACGTSTSSGCFPEYGGNGSNPQAMRARSQRSFGTPNSHDTGNSRHTDARRS